LCFLDIEFEGTHHDRDLYRTVLVDTPLALYFSENISSEDLDEMNIEILRNTLHKVNFSFEWLKLSASLRQFIGVFARVS
jgi:vacuolar-type H+-ATPase subunit C/Vma6|tara:strand:+ start:169 stop:408 length:240 start_codon:yes stop_codon:yes gene_type:complete